VAFRVEEEELPLWEARLKAAGYPVFWAQWPGGKSLYTQDPAGNLVELAPGRIWGL
jgi:catechol-2,3-dioxygenase